MRTSMRSAATAAVVTAVLAAGGASLAAASPARAAHWRVSYTAPSNLSAFAGTAALSSKDVWAVGDAGTPAPGSQRSLIRRWNGASWADVRLPRAYSRAQLFSVAGSSPTNVWVFGQLINTRSPVSHDFALRWNGAWARMGLWATSSGRAVNAIVLGKHDVWLFGGAGTRHYNGHRWTTFTLPYALSAASAVSGSDIWAVGAASGTGLPVVARWHNGSWTLQAVPVIASNHPGPAFTNLVARSDNDVWVVGGTVTSKGDPRPLSLRWHGGKWTRYLVKGVDYLGSIVNDGTGGFWAALVGPYDGGQIEHFGGGSWHAVLLPRVTGKATSVYALARVARSTTAYAVGSTVFGGFPATNALILRYGR